MLEAIRKIPFWAYLCLLGFITFYTYDIRITSDMGWYMNSALNIFLGKGYADIDGSSVWTRGPIFPLMIATSYWLLGVSPWSAFWVVRIFCILNPLMVYLLGKKFYGKWIGISAALLVLTSYSINYWSYRHLDAVWPFFVLTGVLSLSIAFEKEKVLYFLGAGLLVASALLIKETAILISPLPALLLLLVPDYRTRRNLWGCLTYFSVILLLVTPWIYYVYEKTGTISVALLGVAGQVAFSEITVRRVQQSSSVRQLL